MSAIIYDVYNCVDFIVKGNFNGTVVASNHVVNNISRLRLVDVNMTMISRVNLPVATKMLI